MCCGMIHTRFNYALYAETTKRALIQAKSSVTAPRGTRRPRPLIDYWSPIGPIQHLHYQRSEHVEISAASNLSLASEFAQALKTATEGQDKEVA